MIASPNDEDVQSILDAQRVDSEAKDIIKDLDNLLATPVEKHGRWVWELLQNARDCARQTEDGKEIVNVKITLTKDRLEFEHDGKCFKLGDLISLVRKTSNKDYQNREGNTGKYGTGFVTTHLLSRKVTIEGFLQVKQEHAEFSILLDRSSSDKDTLQQKLSTLFNEIDGIKRTGKFRPHEKLYTRFIYQLSEQARQIAYRTLQEFKDNIYFTLRCNPCIQSVEVCEENTDGSIVKKIFKEYPPITFKQGIMFYPWEDEKDGIVERGVLYSKDGSLEIGIPAKKVGNSFIIIEAGTCAKLYKELPMIGTEGAHLPFFVQSHDFRPPEPRDGLRLKINKEVDADPIAETNRDIVSQIPKFVISLFNILQEAYIGGLYLLTESGLPIDPYNYLDPVWYEDAVQKPLRAHFKNAAIVSTVEKQPLKKIEECYFIDFPHETGKEEFYKLASELIPDKFPDEHSYSAWDNILHQDHSKWPQTIFYTIDKLIDQVVGYKKLENFPLSGKDTCISWLNRLFSLLRNTHLLDKVGTKAIYPTQAGTLEVKSILKLDTINNEQFKNIVAILWQPIRTKLVADKFKSKEGIEPLDTKEHMKLFHDHISKLDVKKLTSEQVSAVLELVSLFRSAQSHVRKELYDLVQELLPNTPAITEVSDMGFYDWGSADLLAAKYCCSRVEDSQKLKTFSETFFGADEDVAIEWLDRLIGYLAGEAEVRKPQLERFKVIPVQSGNFKANSVYLRSEDSDKPFDDLLKNLCKDFVKNDPWEWLVDRRINKRHFLLISIGELVKCIDDLFVSDSAEEKVKPDGIYNSLFHQVNNYIKTSRHGYAFETFNRRLAHLLHKAMGDSISKQVLILQKWERSDNDLEEMGKLKLPASDLAALEKAAISVGTDTILAHAISIENGKEKAKWRTTVGGNAENAFKTAIQGIEAQILDPNNENEDGPDLNVGFDFSLLLKGCKDPYYIEIKSIGNTGKETVAMTMRQGEHARDNSKNYALCVIVRQDDDSVSQEQFMASARFITDIGLKVGPKVDAVRNGLNNLTALETMEVEDVSIALANKTYSVYVSRRIWMDQTAKTFDQFIAYIQSNHIGADKVNSQ